MSDMMDIKCTCGEKRTLERTGNIGERGNPVKTWRATWLARLHIRIRRWLLPKLHHRICPMNKYEYIRVVELFQHRHPYVCCNGHSGGCLCP